MSLDSTQIDESQMLISKNWVRYNSANSIQFYRYFKLKYYFGTFIEKKVISYFLQK